MTQFYLHNLLILQSASEFTPDADFFFRHANSFAQRKYGAAFGFCVCDFSVRRGKVSFRLSNSFLLFLFYLFLFLFVAISFSLHYFCSIKRKENENLP